MPKSLHSWSSESLVYGHRLLSIRLKLQNTCSGASHTSETANTSSEAKSALRGYVPSFPRPSRPYLRPQRKPIDRVA
eukprot:7004981-Pyramimonas_sp.AAC.3